MAKFTLADLGATSVPYELKHPKTGEPLGVFVEVTGADTAEYRDLEKAQVVREAALPKGSTRDVLTFIADSEALLLTCIRGWSDNEFFGGEFTKDRALAIIKNPAYGWLKEQLDRFTDDRKNFFRVADGQPAPVTA